MIKKNSNTIRVAGGDAIILSPSDFFQVSCSVSGCESNCCTKSAPIVLNPYEIALICREASMSYEDLLDVVETERAKNFPLVMLPRDPACHFFTGKGCAIYPARPLACRLYPLGRIFENGQSYIVHPRVNICSGVILPAKRTVADYLAGQSAEMLMKMSDQWIDFVSDVERLPLPDAPVTSIAFHMLVYSPDTPPSPGSVDLTLTLEDRFILRLKSAREQIPRFLRIN